MGTIKIPTSILPISLLLFVTMSVAVGLAVVPVAFGAQEWVTLATDKVEYDDGEMITVRGTVFQLYSSYPMTIMVVAPNNNNVVYLDQITVSHDKKFSTQFKAGGSLMKIPGDYKIIAQYGSETRKADTEFKYGKVIIPEEVVIPTPPRQITIEGYLMTSTMTSGEVTNMSPNQNENMLTVSVHNVDEAGTLIMAIPRDILDSVVDGQDTEFFAFIGNNNVDVEEVDTNEFDRTIIISYPEGTRTIEIIGTHAIPEFGSIAPFILMILITLVIIVTKPSLIITNK